jgi:hypothetical protein
MRWQSGAPVVWGRALASRRAFRRDLIPRAELQRLGIAAAMPSAPRIATNTGGPSRSASRSAHSNPDSGSSVMSRNAFSEPMADRRAWLPPGGPVPHQGADRARRAAASASIGSLDAIHGVQPIGESADAVSPGPSGLHDYFPDCHRLTQQQRFGHGPECAINTGVELNTEPTSSEQTSSFNFWKMPCKGRPVTAMARRCRC